VAATGEMLALDCQHRTDRLSKILEQFRPGRRHGHLIYHGGEIDLAIRLP